MMIREFDKDSLPEDIATMTLEEAAHILARHTDSNDRMWSPRPHMAKACQLAIEACRRISEQENNPKGLCLHIRIEVYTDKPADFEHWQSQEIFRRVVNAIIKEIWKDSKLSLLKQIQEYYGPGGTATLRIYQNKQHEYHTVSVTTKAVFQRFEGDHKDSLYRIVIQDTEYMGYTTYNILEGCKFINRWLNATDDTIAKEKKLFE